MGRPEDDDLIPDPPEGYTAKGLGGAYARGLENEVRKPGSRRIDTTRPTGKGGSTQGQLPLGPPGSGRGFKDAPTPTREGFADARRRELDRNRPKTDEELRDEDLRKLRELCRSENEKELRDNELDAFPDMLERLERSRFPLSPKQREWVDGVIDRQGIDVPDEPEIGGEYVPKHRRDANRTKTLAELEAERRPPPVSPAHAKAQAFLDGLPEGGARVSVNMGDFRAAAARAAEGAPFEMPPGSVHSVDELDAAAVAKKELTGTLCGDCGFPQWKSPGGVTCDRGHGGAPAAEANPGKGAADALWAVLGPAADAFRVVDGRDDRWLPFELASGFAAVPLVRTERHVVAFLTHEKGRAIVDGQTAGGSTMRWQLGRPPSLTEIATACLSIPGDDVHPKLLELARKWRSTPQTGDNLGKAAERGYLSRADFEKDGIACPLDELCQLQAEHGGDCDPRHEKERWNALHRALDAGKEGEELEEAMKPPEPVQGAKTAPMPPVLGVRPEQRKRRRLGGG